MAVPICRATADGAVTCRTGKELPASGTALPRNGNDLRMIASPADLFDPLSLLIVLGGTVAAAAMSGTGGDLKRALRALRPLFGARPVRDAEAADQATRQIQRIADYRGIVAADRVRTPVDFVMRAARRLAEAEDAQAYREWAAETLSTRRARHAGAIGIWRSAAEAAPAMGMIGTVLGLIGMFAGMDDVGAMGPAMATAMLTTLYGLVLAAGVAGPVATRLERLSAAELVWQQKVLQRLEALARAEEEAVQAWVGKRRRAATP